MTLQEQPEQPASLNDHVREWQDMHDMSDADMVAILCELLQNAGMAPTIKEQFPLTESED
jgi:hypothetical protein